MSISSSTTFDLTFDLQNGSYPHFEIDPLPWYCINYPKWGNVLLFKDPFIEHPQGVKIFYLNEILRFYQLDYLCEVCKVWTNENIYFDRWLVDLL